MRHLPFTRKEKRFDTKPFRFWTLALKSNVLFSSSRKELPPIYGVGLLSSLSPEVARKFNPEDKWRKISW